MFWVVFSFNQGINPLLAWFRSSMSPRSLMHQRSGFRKMIKSWGTVLTGRLIHKQCAVRRGAWSEVGQCVTRKSWCPFSLHFRATMIQVLSHTLPLCHAISKLEPVNYGLTLQETMHQNSLSLKSWVSDILPSNEKTDLNTCLPLLVMVKRKLLSYSFSSVRNKHNIPLFAIVNKYVYYSMSKFNTTFRISKSNYSILQM